MAAAVEPPAEQRYEASRLWLVRGRYFDLSGFFHKHPGGEMVLRQSMGSDITALIESSHFKDTPFQVMLKYEVQVSAVDGCIPDAGYSFKDDGFFRTLKRRVATRLGRNARDGPTILYKIRVAATLIAFLISWGLCTFRPLWWPAVVVASVSRIVLVGIGHEAIHGRCQSLWHLFDAMFLFPSDHWHFEHVTLHHPHTKRFGDNYKNPDALHYDPDEDLNGLLRLHPLTPWRCFHRIQAALQIVVAMFTTFAAFVEYHLIACRSVVLGSVFCLCQLAPLFFAPDGGWIPVLIVILCANSLILHAFHLSHVNERNGVYTMYEGVDWGEHQMRTTSSWQTSWYSISGMLEHQIEHHLFPTLPYGVQRNVIRPIVQEVAKEFGLPYYEYKGGMLHGIFYHMVYMHILGERPVSTEDEAPYFLISSE